MDSSSENFENFKAANQSLGSCNDNNSRGNQQDFFNEAILSFEEHLAIPTFIRQGKLLSYSHGAKR